MLLCQSTSLGLIFAALSSLLFSVCSLLAKVLGLNSAEISCISFLAVVLISFPMAISRYKHIIPPKGYRLLFVGRSVTGTMFLISSFRAVQLIPLGDASILFATAPILTLFLAKLFLREPCTLYNVFMIIVLMSGIVLVTQSTPSDPEFRIPSDYYVGVIYALLASLSEAVGNVILRKLKFFHFSIIMFNHGVLSFVQTTLFVLLTSSYSFDHLPFLSLAVLVLGSAFEQLLVTLALSMEPAGPVAFVQASDIIYAYLLQVFFLGEVVLFLPLMGAALVTGVIIHMAIMQTRQETRLTII